jgi:hypothetical protein
MVSCLAPSLGNASAVVHHKRLVDKFNSTFDFRCEKSASIVPGLFTQAKPVLVGQATAGPDLRP